MALLNREVKEIQANRLFDLYSLNAKATEDVIKKMLKTQIARAESGMDAEEVAYVKDLFEKSEQ